jgi:hypothetical protein
VERDYEVPTGLLIVTPSRSEDKARLGAHYELIIWISRAQRSSGLGEKVRLSPKAEELTKSLKGKRVVVRYPATGGIGGEDLNRVRWFSYFSLLGFKPHRRCPLKPEQEWVLVKTY